MCVHLLCLNLRQLLLHHHARNRRSLCSGTVCSTSFQHILTQHCSEWSQNDDPARQEKKTQDDYRPFSLPLPGGKIVLGSRNPSWTYLFLLRFCTFAQLHRQLLNESGETYSRSLLSARIYGDIETVPKLEESLALAECR